MASPCACGGLALLVSALKAEEQAVTPARVRRAVENTCLPVAERAADGVLTYGRGLLQVQAAYKYLRRSAAVDVPAGARGGRPYRPVCSVRPWLHALHAPPPQFAVLSTVFPPALQTCALRWPCAAATAVRASMASTCETLMTLGSP